MKTYTPAQFKKILTDHAKYLETRFSDKPKGKQADLSSANLRGADLSGANLSSANLRGADLSSANLSSANLSSANLRGADLSGANLSSANLRGADLSSANLSSANLRGADLSSANLRGANLRSADLRGADLYDANLSGANLYDANLSGANLRSADLRGANLRGAKKDENTVLYPGCTLPEDGSFTAWKKVAEGVILKLEVIGSRVSYYGSRKCRTDQVRVLAAYNMVGDKLTGAEYSSIHDPNFKYVVGEIAAEPACNLDPAVECTNGIHFFMTRKEAEQYN